MFGYEMSWASFHVLEVMSSTKFLQKRAGYLGALQSFRPETEVLMLATNLLKKDMICPDLQIISLPLTTLPNIITPSLAMSLLPDVLSRVSHTKPSIRKKAVVCLYRLALVYPEALKLAWPKLKDCLMDDAEDSSVTTAVLNVICELGWRRPHDFLPLAPRFFELLVEGGNNWMAIKIIKLFATLTPLEPRLVRKLIRPLMNIVQTTTAMSLLYECINGIIQGGILEGEGALDESLEIADICVTKLRGMVVTDSDPNLKYVALLAFSRIVMSHAHLVSMHQDVILNCLEDADVSIRLQALELATQMVTKDNLHIIVERLIEQLQGSRETTAAKGADSERGAFTELGNYAQEDAPRKDKDPFNLPHDYRVEVLHRVLDICSNDNYSKMADFEWYVDVLIRLVKHLPPRIDQIHGNDSRSDPAGRIGLEMRNIAVRVKNVRKEATKAAEFLLMINNRQSVPANLSSVKDTMLGPLAWVVGEYAEYLSSPGQTLQSLIDTSNLKLPGKALSLFIQAAPKILARIIHEYTEGWGAAQRSEVALFMARIVEFLEILAAHPDLDVQERAIEFLEIIRLTADIMQTGAQQAQVPYLLSSVVPGLFHGLELNPVAPNAQRKVPLPDQLFLDVPFNSNVRKLFEDSQDDTSAPTDGFYHARELHTPNKQSGDFGTIGLLSSNSNHSADTSGEVVSTAMRQKIEWKQRIRDDPFYIGADGQGSSTTYSEDLDIDSIPIIDLQLGSLETSTSAAPPGTAGKLAPPKRYEVIPDEIIGLEETPSSEFPGEPVKTRRSLLQIDSSGLTDFNMQEHRLSSNVGTSGKVEEDAEMATAMQEIEKVRLRMQRASERVQLEGAPSDGTLVKKKKKPKKSIHATTRGADALLVRDGQIEGGQKSSSTQRKPKRRSKAVENST
ncbi:adaptin N terminal region-domain-containing protein [Aspergillus filifer]